MKRIRIAAFLVLCVCSVRSSRAGNCSWTIAPANVNFGNYSVFNPSRLLANTSFTVTCTPNQGMTVKLNTGANSASFTPRTLKQTTAPGTLLPYNLFQDAAAQTQIFGDGSGGTTFFDQFNSLPGSKDFPDTIYGAMPAASDVPAGTYTDTITGTLTSTGGSVLPTTFTVTATVIPECIVSSFTIDFGTYDPIATNLTTPSDSSALVNIYCTKSTAGTVALDAGQNSAAGTRRMVSGGVNFLNYEIYKDSARSVVWNATNTNNATSTSRFTPLGGGFRAFARIPPGQNAAVGNYTDTVQATVNY